METKKGSGKRIILKDVIKKKDPNQMVENLRDLLSRSSGDCIRQIKINRIERQLRDGGIIE